MDATKTYAIDLSHHNSVFDWNKLNPAVKIVIHKASEGSTIKDDTLTRDITAAKKKGLTVGYYHFLHSTSSAIGQADNFLTSNVNFGPGTLPPIVDIEQENDKLDALNQRNPAGYLKIITDFLNIVQEHTGRVPIIYTDPGYWPVLHNPDLSKYPLWVAAYQANPPKMFGNWKNWVMWQFSQYGTYLNPVAPNGAKGDVDWSMWNPNIQLSSLIK